MSHDDKSPQTASSESDFLPLQDLVVIDLTQFIAGPYCTMLMADAGAQVIKVEPPAGDASRRSEPPFATGSGDRVGAAFLRMNRNKRSVTLDLKSATGKEALKHLLAHADVLVENFRVGVLDRLGLGKSTLDQLNPGLIYCSISGFGHTESDRRDHPAFNLIAEYEAGVYKPSDVDGTPTPLGPYVGDLFPALNALSGILMALHRRSVTDQGASVDIAMFDAMLALNELAGSNETWLADPAASDLSNFYSPSGVFASQDGYVCIDLVTNKQWQTLCSLIGHPELYAMPELSTGRKRAERFDEFISQPLHDWLRRHASEDAVHKLSSNGVPAAVVREPGEALLSEQARQRGMVTKVGFGPFEHAAADSASMKVAASPIRIDDMAAPQPTAAPQLGQHTAEVLRDIAGLSADQIAAIQSNS